MPDDPIQPDPHLPSAFSADLRAAHGHHVSIPPEFDSALLAEARRRISARQPRAVWLRTFRLGGAGAAVAALLVAGVYLFHAEHTPAHVALRGDLNGDGKVDILDAFYLSRHLNSPSPEFDVNGDGKVDQADVDALAAQAVRIGGVQ